jgi:hypothetical protein
MIRGRQCWNNCERGKLELVCRGGRVRAKQASSVFDGVRARRLIGVGDQHAKAPTAITAAAGGMVLLATRRRSCRARDRMRVIAFGSVMISCWWSGAMRLRWVRDDRGVGLMAVKPLVLLLLLLLRLQGQRLLLVLTRLDMQHPPQRSNQHTNQRITLLC